jgi:hypothetical protein
MVEWMSEVLKVFKSPRETFFCAVSVMDRYFNDSKEVLSLDVLHEIGVVSIFIASKFTELEPLTLDLMYRKASHGKISERQILAREMIILNTLKFKVASPTLMDCTDNLKTMLSLDSDAFKRGLPEVETHLDSLMETAALNFRFTFEMKPSQVALAIIKLACTRTEKTGAFVMDPDFRASFATKQTYSKGRIQGIMRRLTECQKAE